MEPIEAGGPEQAGRYRLQGRLGAGATATVYLGVAPDGVQVAVKVVHPGLARDPGFRARFRREIDLSRRVGGPWVAEVVDADPNAEPPWVATRFVPGPSLEAAVRTGGPFGVDGVRSLGHGLARGLEAVHAAGVVHRNLKPSNVLLDATHPRLVDIGFSPAGDGTGFRAPEQIAGQETTTAADVYALGAVLYFAATGRSPSGGADLSALPDPLRSPIAACLAPRPHDRPAASVAAQLLQPPPPQPGFALPPPPARAGPARFPRRRGWLIGVVAVAAAAALVFTLPAVLPEPTPPGPPPEPPPAPSASAPAPAAPLEVSVTATRPVWERAGDHVLDPSGEYVHLSYPAGYSISGCDRGLVQATCLEMRPAVGEGRSAPIFLEGLSAMDDALALTPDGSRIFLTTTTTDNQVHVAVVDLQARSLTHLIPTGGPPIVPFERSEYPKALVSAPNGTRAALVRGDTVTIVDVETSTARPITITGQAAGSVPSFGVPITDVAFTPDGRNVVVATSTGLEIIDVDAGRVSATALGGTQLQDVAVMPDGSRALAVTSNDVLSVDLPSVRVTPLARIGDSSHRIESIAISADGRRAFAAGHSLWGIDTADGSTTEVQINAAYGGTFDEVELSRTGNTGAVADLENVHFFEWT